VEKIRRKNIINKYRSLKHLRIGKLNKSQQVGCCPTFVVGRIIDNYRCLFIIKLMGKIHLF